MGQVHSILSIVVTPVYYDLYPGDGSVWRFMATDLTGELGKLVSYTDPRGRVLTNDDFGVDIVRASNGLLRQVLTPSRLADIVTRGSTGYTFTVYPLTELPAFANGLYALPPHAATEVLTVDRGEDVKHLIVTLKKGGASAQRYNYVYVNGDWTLVHPDGVVKQKEIYYGDDDNTAQMVALTKDAGGNLWSRKENLFVFKSWGFAKTNSVEGFGTAKRSTSWSYVTSGAAIGKVSEKKDSTGAVVQYGYDSNGRQISITYPNRSEVVTTSYAPVDPADQILLNDTRPRTVTRTINAIEVGRTYYAFLPTQEIVERVATQGAAYGAAGNLRTVTTWYPAAEDDYSAGRLKSVRYEDGQMDLYTYSWIDSIWTETVTRVHEDELDPVAMQATRRSAIYSRIGNLVAERTELMTAAGVWEQIDGVAYEYNVNGKETKRTTFNGLVTTSEWAGTCCGKSSETASDGTRTTFTYDDSGRLIVRTVLDPNSIETHLGYDAIGRQIVTWTTNRVAHLGTTPLRTTYDALGRVVSQTDNLGNTTTYSYSANERTTTTTHPIGSTEVIVTDESGRPLTVTGTAVAPRTYTYGVNADGSQWTKVYNGSNATAIAWTKTTKNMFGRTIHEEKPGFGSTLLTTTYTYDDGGRALSQTQNAISGSVSSVLSVDLQTYDLYGARLFSALDINHNGVIDFVGPDRITGYTTAYITKDNALWQESDQAVYPDFNGDRAVTTAQSRRKLTNFASFASISESEDIRGNVTTTTQTVDRNTGLTVSSTTVPTSIQPQLQIQNNGQLVESISTTAITNRYAYDGLNRQFAVTDGRGNTTVTAYNTLGHVAYTEDAATNRTSYVYDQFGRQIETVDALNQSKYTAYDLRGSVVKQYGATYPVWYEYDSEGRMTKMATTRDTTLDPATVDSLDHPSLDVTQWTYNPASGLLVQKLYEDGKGPSYTYTIDGKPETRSWARGIVTEYGYDVLGQLVGIDYSDTTPDVAYSYDRLGRQLSAIAAGVSTNLYAYSTNTLELIAETQNGVVIDRTNDTLGRAAGFSVAGVGDPGSPYAVTYAYDTYGRFGSVSSSGSTYSYSYLPGASLVSGMTASTGHAWTRAYESNRNLITSVTNSFNGNLISAFDYLNDEIGRRTARLDVFPGDLATTNAFGYNTRSEVISATMGTNTYGYVFDPIGNRISATNNAEVTAYVANELNQYTNILCASVPLREPSHDDDGNMTFLPSTSGGGAGGEGWYLQWNGENRLICAEEQVCPTNRTLRKVDYAYDHQGRMVWKKISRGGAEAQSWDEEKATSYLWEDNNILAETIAQNTATNTTYNTWGLDLDGTMQGAGGVGGLLAVVKDAATYVPAFDANGNTMEYVSADGTIAAHREYDPFGGTVVAAGNTDDFTHWFSTKPWSPITGLSEYQYRKYSPVMGRWLSRDPIGALGGVHYYAFVLNSSINAYDPEGHKGCCGPDHTASLEAALVDAETRFKSAKWYNKLIGCFNLTQNPLAGLSAWDLGFTEGGSDGCEGTITINGGCYDPSEVNYALWGRGAKLCKAFFFQARNTAWLYKMTLKALDNYLNDDHPDGWFGTSKSVFEWNPQISGWTKYGYDGTIPPTSKDCEPSSTVREVRLQGWPW